MKNQCIRGELPEKGGGLEQLADLRGEFAKKTE